MDKFRETFGYVLGFLLFVVLIPVLMWLCSKMPPFSWPPIVRLILGLCCAIDGLTLSIWAIVYMRRVGDGNPMDAFGHEVAPRTQHLMVEGPYKINRNPMLTGTLVYLAGAAVWLWRWQAAIVLVAFFAIMMVQVLSEERRLRRDFGEEYEAYCKRSRRF